jgi:hypothetical protein
MSEKERLPCRKKMKEQNFKNHTRLIFMYHGVTLLAAAVAWALALFYFIDVVKDGGSMKLPLMLLLATTSIVSIALFARSFALKAQDRAIRAEENFRHFILTGKPFDGRVNIGQIIALRFASDGEFPELAKKAAEENLDGKTIKGSIKNWRADHHRV